MSMAAPHLPEAKLRERVFWRLVLAGFAKDEGQATQMSRAACFTYSRLVKEKHSLLAASSAALRHPSVAGRSLGLCCMEHSFKHTRVLHGQSAYHSSSFSMYFLLCLVQESVAVANKDLLQRNA